MTRELSLLFYAAVFVVALVDLQKYEKCTNNRQNGTCVARHECPELEDKDSWIGYYSDDCREPREYCCVHPKYYLQKYEKCTNPYGLNGTCVALHECPELYNLSSSKYGIDLLYVTESYCGLDDEVLVCCEHPGHVQLTHVDVNSLLGNKECGIVKEKPRIDGENAEIGEFPWTVALIYEIYDTKKIVEWIPCSGSLINNEYVLTAASCIDFTDRNIIFVKLGEWNSSTDPDCVDLVANKFCADPVKIVGIKETIVHPLSGIYKDYHDVALIRLEEKVIFTDFIAPICLPHSKYVTPFPEALGQLTLVGWKPIGDSTSDVLTKKTLHVSSDYECWKSRLNDRPLDRHSFCAVGKNLEIDWNECAYYFGSPLMKSYGESNGVVWYIHGIKPSYTCILEYNPVLAVSHYVDWIIKTTIAYSKTGL